MDKDIQLQRFYALQAFIMGKVKVIELNNGFASAKDEFRSLKDTLRKYYAFEYTAEGLKAYERKQEGINRYEN